MISPSPVTICQMISEIDMLLDVAFEIHRDEAVKLPQSPDGAWRRHTLALERPVIDQILLENHLIGLLLAKPLTSVGLILVSIGPAISVSVAGHAG